MKTIGLIGGMSWESTALYYRLINQGVQQALGALHSARIVLYSLDFAVIAHLQKKGDWDGAAAILAQAAQALESGGADFLLLCTNTMHKVAAAIQAAVQIPLIHIADATAEELQAQSIRRVALLGTAFTPRTSWKSTPNWAIFWMALPMGWNRPVSQMAKVTANEARNWMRSMQNRATTIMNTVS